MRLRVVKQPALGFVDRQVFGSYSEVATSDVDRDLRRLPNILIPIRFFAPTRRDDVAIRRPIVIDYFQNSLARLTALAADVRQPQETTA
jgi:hypothetical protein